MPPDGRPRLSPSDREKIRSWIDHLPVPAQTPGLVAEQASTYVNWLKTQSKPGWRPNPSLPIEEVIDGFVRRGWKARDVVPARVAPDAAFVRRAYLDLAGRIPTLDELRRHLENRSSNKRELLIDSLIGSEDYARRLRDVFDVTLMSRATAASTKSRTDSQWHEFLQNSFRSNRPWNEIVRAMVLARPTQAPDRGAHWFLYERRDNHQAAVEALAPVAYGMRIDCAQCHNHPLSWEIEQRHYWGMVAALKRSKNVDSAAGPGVAESAIGGFVNFSNLKKESQPALLVFPNGREVAEVRPEAQEKEVDRNELYLVPPPPEKQPPERPSVPIISRREALAGSICDNNPLLARAFVNRIWALLMGRGFVHPVDLMDSKHPPSHPELLDWLSRDFERSGYDVKRLVRGITLSLPYRLDSKRSGSRPPSAAEAFATGLEKPLTAEQLFSSLRVLAGTWNQALSDEETRLLPVLTERFPEVMPVDYQFTLQQAMFLSNNPDFHRLLTRSGPGERETVPELFRRMVGREPSREELQAVLRWGGPDPSRRMARAQWALATSPEFLLNH